MQKLISESKSYFIKPVTLGFLLLVYTINLFMAELEIYLIMLIAGVLILSIMDYEKLVKVITSFFILLAIAHVMNRYFQISGWLGSIYTMIIIMLRMFPVWILALSFASYNSSVLMNSLRNIGLPNNLVIAITVFFRFLPDYKAYLMDIRESLKVRNIAFKWKEPLASFELYLVPMMYKAFQTSEILTCSLITKGIECEGKKTSYENLRLSLLDYLLLLYAVCLLAVTLWKRF